MTETQLREFPPFRTLPVYDESDPRSHALVRRVGRSIRECTTAAEVEACVTNPKLVPVGAVRAGGDERQVVVAYFFVMA